MKLATSIFATLVLFSVSAAADSAPTPGTKGTVTAYENDGTTVVLVKACPRSRSSFNYTTCGPALRTDVKKLMCERGKGTKTWKYRVGDGPLMSQTTACR
ncbi:MAG: hypothetical protein IPK71_27715 [Myxococcales bacterium]|jgi:hypothetical protein|nr:hypothetical protein [Myxococcales bacterium]